MDNNALSKTLLTSCMMASLGLLAWFYPPSALADLSSQETINVTWIERYGFIIHNSICTDYDFGSLARQECQMHAKNIFEKECEARQYKAETDEQRVKYCRAAMIFEPD